MSIHYFENGGRFVLETAHTTYQMKIDETGVLRHLYFGQRCGRGDLSFLFRSYDHGFSGNPYEKRLDRSYSLDTMPQEYPSRGVGDFRISGIGVVCSDGSRCADFRYASYEILKGKYEINGLPSVYDNGNEAETLIISLTDMAAKLSVKLYYGVFEELDIITRAVEIVNTGSDDIYIEKAASACLDLHFGNWELIHFHGRHCMERQPERIPVYHGVHTLSSSRGMSSHQHNPFVILCDSEATENSGDCCGIMLMYSGNHKTEVELDQFDNVRVVAGINDDGFCWELGAGESFNTPEVIMSFADGLTSLSHNFHDIIRNNVVRGEYKLSHRPILINNWEATYFDITEKKLLAIAEKAKELGIELFVLDDGWFKNRNDDNAGLGDWETDTEKLPAGLDGLIEKINAAGLKFGLWIEPEMISEDSDLYRAHPDWALAAPNRPPMMSRNQLVLDMSREDVFAYLLETFSGLLEKYAITYIKWDYNRSVSDVYSHALPCEKQGEVAHRYYLNLYRLYNQLTTRFPHVLFEGCAGGGGRFDAGMLSYSPQIWCSDNTDPVERLKIQYGTSFGYPSCTVGAHVSASPNHQTGRETPLATRGIVAMSGVLGYELDLSKLSGEECAQIKEQIRRYKEIEPLVQDGRIYRLSSLKDMESYAAWQYVSRDGSRAVVNLVVTNPTANFVPVHIRPKGLLPGAVYSVGGEFECTGLALMRGGYTFPRLSGDYPSAAVDIIMTGQGE